MKTVPSSVVERLIEAAVQLFSRQGFRGTTTRQIARLANVNETSLFRHFARKQDLFWAALESQLGQLRVSRELTNGLVRDEAPELVLPLIIEFLVLTAMYQPQLLRLVWVSLMELRPDADKVYRRQLEPIFQAIKGYLEQCIASGTLRSVDSSLITIALTAATFAHQELHAVVGRSTQSYSETDDAVKAYSRFWLDALSPSSESNLAPRRAVTRRRG